MNMEDALHTFIVESRELLEEMEATLLYAEQAPNDVEVINSLFRAAHTIKGSAGLFGLDRVVEFTHVAESVLDRVRSWELVLDLELIALLLEARDHISLLIDSVASGTEATAEEEDVGLALIALLETRLSHPPALVETQPMIEKIPTASADNVDLADTDNWHLSLRFGRDVLRDGMDPLSCLHYLSTFGTIVGIVTLTDAVPRLSALDPEACFLGFEVSFRSDADKATIESAFEFVRETSVIRILPPRSKVAEYLRLIGEMPEEAMKLGEILVRCGTLTQAELHAVLLLQADVPDSPPIGQILVEQALVEGAVVDAALDKQRQVKEGAGVSLIRVDAGKLDELINLVGELIIAGASTGLAAQRTGASELIESTSVLSRLVEAVRDSALSLRMVQIGATFSKFQRVVRDTGKELGKEIELVISGAETELDKAVVEKIADPLTHLVRNAIDHGIGLPEVRVAKGKPRQGTIRLNAYHDSGSVVIEVSDDGSGLKKERILAKAIERGLAKAGQTLSDQEIFNLIFEPGFSTAATVSNISGRGVGMDVVKQNIAALRGTVDIESVAGQGTTVRIRLPLTLAIIDGFLVGVGQSAYVIPLDTVVECIELSREDSAASLGNNYLNLRDQVLPFIRLRELFDQDDHEPHRENVVVVQYGSHRAGLVVDRLLGEFQTVIKPLGKVFGNIRGIGGFTIMGDGEVALILDVPNLISSVTQQHGRRHAPSKAAAPVQLTTN